MRKNILKLVLVIIVFTSVGLIFSQQQNSLFIRDILDNAQRYYNLEVNLQGNVTEVFNAPNPNTRGYYSLMDNSDKTIKIIANSLPAPNKKLMVTGIVQIDTQSQIPYIREIRRSEIGTSTGETVVPGGAVTPQLDQKEEGLNPVIIGLIALIGIIIIALFVVILNKPKKEPSVPSVQPQTPAAPPAPKVSMKTKQVSIDDVNRQVGGLKTKQVPNLLAELKVLSGSLSGKSFPLTYETTIGRVSGDIVLEDASVSREHAKIVYSSNSYKLENLSETNPAILNGSRIQTSKALKDGDEIVLGVIKLKFKLI